MFILKKGHQPVVYVPLRALFLVFNSYNCKLEFKFEKLLEKYEFLTTGRLSFSVTNNSLIFYNFTFTSYNLYKGGIGKIVNEPRHEKTNILHMRKQKRRSASR